MAGSPMNEDTRHLGVCVPHQRRFEPGEDCPACARAVEQLARLGPNAGSCAHQWPNGRRMACSVVEQELTFDECVLLELDGTGRDGDAHIPWRVGHLTPAQQSMLRELWDGTLCECGHPAWDDGHDMHTVPPVCNTPGCACGIEAWK